jgi:hypothetical protein
MADGRHYNFSLDKNLYFSHISMTGKGMMTASQKVIKKEQELPSIITRGLDDSHYMPNQGQLSTKIDTLSSHNKDVLIQRHELIN